MALTPHLGAPWTARWRAARRAPQRQPTDPWRCARPPRPNAAHAETRLWQRFAQVAGGPQGL